MVFRNKSKASLTIEAALIFPLLFMLWMCVIAVLFRLYAGCIIESACSRAFLSAVSQGLPAASEDIAGVFRSSLETMLDSSGISLKLLSCHFQSSPGFLSHSYDISLSFSHELWGTVYFASERSAAVLSGSSVRNLADLVWDIGKDLPYVGDLLGKYQEKIHDLQGFILQSP